MAQNQPRTVWQTLATAFFGTPKRTLVTAGGAFILFTMLCPELALIGLNRALAVLATALMPFVPIIITIGIVWLGFKIMLKCFR